MQQEITLTARGFAIPRPRVSSVLIAIILLLLIGLFHVWLRVGVIQGEYAVSRLEHQIRQQSYEVKTLTVQVAQLTNPANIEKIATTRLGLMVPAAAQVKIVTRK